MATILIVEDDADMAEVVKDLLEAEGHDVYLADNGEEGLRQLAIRLPDVVLLDIEMPLLDGPGMVCRMFIHDLGMEKIPIVLSSGAADAVKVSREVGTPYLLGKPYGQGALCRMIQKAVSERIAPSPKFTP